MKEGQEVWNLPIEENQKIRDEENEKEGEHFCKKCNGWGYINKPPKTVGGFSSWPIQKCPDCEGRGITDWIRNTRGKK